MADLKPLSGQLVFGSAQCRKDWMKVSSEFAQDWRDWNASNREMVMAAQPSLDECHHKYK